MRCMGEKRLNRIKLFKLHLSPAVAILVFIYLLILNAVGVLLRYKTAERKPLITMNGGNELFHIVMYLLKVHGQYNVKAVLS